MLSGYEKEIRDKVGHIPMLRDVCTLIIYNNGKILLQKRSDNGTWAIHGGGMEPGEEYLETLQREIQEELNIKPINPKLMGIYSGKKLFITYPSKDQAYVINHVFLCEEYEGKINFLDGEVKELKWFDLDNLPENIFFLNKPIIKDIKKFIEDGQVIVD